MRKSRVWFLESAVPEVVGKWKCVSRESWIFSVKAGKKFAHCEFEVVTGIGGIQCSVKIVQSVNC